jgi:hypothetical protein
MRTRVASVAGTVLFLLLMAAALMLIRFLGAPPEAYRRWRTGCGRLRRQPARGANIPCPPARSAS